jgi:cobalamin biosynthesis Mg chelatase CobN
VTGISKIKAFRRGGLTIASVLLVAAFALPSSALAQSECTQANSDPTAAQYCSPAGIHEGGTNEGEVKGVSGEGSNEAAPAETETTTPTVEPAPAAEVTAVQESSSSSSLPFTGLDVGVLVVVALALAGTGLFLRRLTAPRDTRS